MSRKEAFEKQYEAQLREWKAEIELLRAKADKADADMRIKYHDQIDNLQEKKEKIRKQLSSLQNAGEEGWQDLKKGLEEAGDSLSKAFSSIKSRFK